MPWAAGLLRGGEFSTIMKPEDDSASSFSAVFLPEHIMPTLHVPIVAVPKGDPIQMKPNRQEDPQMFRTPSDGSEGETSTRSAKRSSQTTIAVLSCLGYPIVGFYYKPKEQFEDGRGRSSFVFAVLLHQSPASPSPTHFSTIAH